MDYFLWFIGVAIFLALLATISISILGPLVGALVFIGLIFL